MVDFVDLGFADHDFKVISIVFAKFCSSNANQTTSIIKSTVLYDDSLAQLPSSFQDLCAKF